jgi:hypothetical protein
MESEYLWNSIIATTLAALPITNIVKELGTSFTNVAVKTLTATKPLSF